MVAKIKRQSFIGLEHNGRQLRWTVEPDEQPLVPYGRFKAPAEITVTLDEPYRVRVRVQVEAGRAYLAGVEQAPGGPSLTGELLRRLPVERVVNEITWCLTYDEKLRPITLPGFLSWTGGAPGKGELVVNPERVVQAGTRVLNEPGGLELLAETARQPGRRRRVDRDKLEVVTAIYRDAIASGVSPSRAIAAGLHVSRSTARRYVQRARDPSLGLLGPALDRKAGEAI